MTIELILPSPIPSKKNSKRLVRSQGRSFLISSKQYAKWHKEAIKPVREKTFIHGTLTAIEKLELIVGMPDKRSRDLDNALSSVLDLLVDGKLLSDDNFMVIPEITISKKEKCNTSKVIIYV